MRHATVFVLLLAGCASASPRRASVSPPDAARAPERIRVEVVPDAPLEGRVAWAFVPAPLLARLESGDVSDADLVALLDGFRVTESLTLDGPTRVGEIPAGRPGGVLAIAQPPGGPILDAIAGGPDATQLRGLARLADPSTGVVRVALERGRARERPERCVGDRRELVTLESPEVAGQIGNDTARRLCVMLPPSYAEAPERRYPVFFLLPGYGGDHTVYAHLVDAGAEAILVGVDGRTRYGTTYFRDTAYAGDWERFLERVVEAIDARYRTVADPDARGLLGHSTGGFNAIALALRRPDLFRAAAASSPDGLDFEAWLADDGVVRPTWLSWTRIEAAMEGPGQMVSYAVQLADASRPGAIAWPFDLETGALDADRWARWLDGDPMTMLEDDAVVARTRAHLDGRLFVSVGRRDAFGLFAPAERFHARLDELGIAHAWAPTDGTHFEGSAERRAAGLAFLMSVLSAPR